MQDRPYPEGSVEPRGAPGPSDCSAPPSPLKVAIIGGGCASMATAFELSRPEHQGRYALTVYQEGWRLGGKGASGRGPSGRIEEHGLHIWLGYYDNAFRMMRDCYAELEQAGAGSTYGHWQDAFLRESDVGLFSPTEQGGWQNWGAHFPEHPGLPGDPLAPGQLMSLPRYLARLLSLLRALVLDCQVDLGQAPSPAGSAARDPSTLLGALNAALKLGAFATAAALAEALAALAAVLDSAPARLGGGWVELAERLCRDLRQWLENTLIAQGQHRHIWEIIDLGLAYVVGVFRFGLLTDPRGLDAIDDHECRAWLRLNGASERAIQSPFVRGMYDLALAYENGAADRPCLSAAQGLRATMRMFFGYRGSIFWRMRAGMGDVVFAPLYDVLERRGVKFEFFHRLTNVGLPPGAELQAGEQSHVRSLTFDVQAQIKGEAAYAPLVEIAGQRCWPAQPQFDQLVEGDRLAAEGANFESHWDRRRAGEKTLEVTRDFDFVVLGISVGAIPHACPELVARDARWRRMTREVKTVATQAFQVWLTQDLHQLGWKGPHKIVAGFVKPYDTWCDMGHVVPQEAWREPPRTSVYFCSVLADPAIPPRDDDAAYPGLRAREARQGAEAFLEGPARLLWPDAYGEDGQFRWTLLADAGDDASAAGEGKARFATQYWRANVSPSERYVQSVPGSARYRISPLDMTYDNLTVAGDWTDCGLNVGCVEAAVMSGLLAAHALSGAPKLEDIVAYDHP